MCWSTNHRLPAVVFLTAAPLSGVAALLGGVRESAQCGAVALLTLAGWAIARGRGAARWSLPAGSALLALAAILQTRGYGQPGTVPPFGNSGINRDRIVATTLLLASVAFLVALRSWPGHPPSRRRSYAALTMIVGGPAYIDHDPDTELVVAPPVALTVTTGRDGSRP